MRWNWQLPKWPKFNYNTEKMAQKECKFFLSLGSASAFLKNVDKKDYQQFLVEILSSEGLESSKIEGEILDRESLQSSIKKHFGLTITAKSRPKESGMATLLCSVYETFNQPLTRKMIESWHYELFKDEPHIEDKGKYRTHPEPMQIVSNRYGSLKVFFEAPPSAKVPMEMANFIKWFNAKDESESILGRAAIAHIYFESIHPFEDGNGRIGRLLVEKLLSKRLQNPLLIAVSKVLEKRKKEYYGALESCNKTLDVQLFVNFFADAILEAQEESTKLLNFLIEKSKMMTRLKNNLNIRQEKALLRMFKEGLSGFKGGLSADNYIAITKTSRATATRDLSDLVKLGALTKTGELKHTRYHLNLINQLQI
jgi:Fic family protein